MGPDLSRTATGARIWARVVGSAAAARFLPVWAGVALVAGVLFGGNGMRPEDLTGLALASPRFAAGLAVTWVVLVVPAGRAMIDPAPTAWLRSLPIGAGVRWAVIAAVAIVVQAPWGVLWILGAGVLRGVAATALAAAGMLAIAELAGRVRWPHRAPRWRTGFGALVGAHRRLLVRARGAALVRAAGVAWLGGAMAGLIARASELDAFEARWWTLAIASLALPIALGALAQPVVDADRRMEWLVRAHGAASATRVAASAAVLALVGALLGVVLALGVLAIDGPSPVYKAAGVPAAASAPTAGMIADPTFASRSSASALVQLAGALVVLGAGLGGLALRAGTWALDRDDGTRVVLAMAGAVVGALVAIGLLGATGVVAIAAVGLAAASALASRRPQEDS